MAIRRLKKKFDNFTDPYERCNWLQKIVIDPESENVSNDDLIRLSRYIGKKNFPHLQLIILINVEDKYLNDSDRISRVYALLRIDNLEMAKLYFSLIPKRSDYKYLLVDALIDKFEGNFFESLQKLELLHYHFKDEYEPMIFLAEVCEELNKKMEALTYYKKVLPLVQNQLDVQENIKNSILELLLKTNTNNYEEYSPYFTKFNGCHFDYTHYIYLKVQYHFNHIYEFRKYSAKLIKLYPNCLHAHVYKILSYHLLGKYQLRNKYLKRSISHFSHNELDFNLIILLAKAFHIHDDYLFLKAMEHYEIIDTMDKKLEVIEYIIDTAVILSKYNDALNFLNRMKSELPDEHLLARHFSVLYLYVNNLDQALYYLNMGLGNAAKDSKLESEMKQILVNQNFMFLLDSHLKMNSDILSNYPIVEKYIKEIRNNTGV